ncbi:MAG: hypothetical protein OXC03_03110 [Flavobacteriaceae bacterium]|nr:hypothetical protein [Flavobacteriaceae bacterium]
MLRTSGAPSSTGWLRLYEQGGLKELLAIRQQGGIRPWITEQTKEAIASMLANPSTTIISYVKLLDWVHKNHRSNISYQVLYNHCRKHHNSVLIISRISHHKKDEEATREFKEENLPGKLFEIKNEIDEAKFDSFNLYFQDESRFGLMAKQRHVLVSKGVKPIVSISTAINRFGYGVAFHLSQGILLSGNIISV